MGLLAGMAYAAERRALAPGDTLLLFTDGVSEAGEGTRAGEFGLDRVEQILGGLRPEVDPALVVATAVDKHLRGRPAGDDITLLCARVRAA
jgi:serine phosphatase RsbU (regulator of sigma subunit)